MPAHKYTRKNGKTTLWWMKFYVTDWTGTKSRYANGALRHRDKWIDINKNYAKVNGEELFLEPKTPKAKRCISIPDFLYDDIHEYVTKLYVIGKGDRIFYFTKSALEKEIKRASQKTGLQPFRVHDLRHSHASMLIELDFTPLEIADLLGMNQFRRTPPPEG